MAPPPDGGAVQRLPDLTSTGSYDSAFGPVKVEAGRIPVQPTVTYQSARLPIEVFDELFLSYFEHGARRQRLAPVTHQLVVTTMITSELAQVVAVRLPV